MVKTKIYQLLIVSISLLTFLQACKSEMEIPEIIPDEVVEGLPVVKTYDATDLNTYSFTVRGEVIDQGDSEIFETGFLVGYAPNPTIEDNFLKHEKEVEDDDRFEITYYAIIEDTLFYIRTYAINDQGVGYGNEIEVQTPTVKRHNGSVTFSNQAQVDSFGLEKYNSISGSLTIEGSVHDLSPLKSLAEVGAAFGVARTTSLKNLSGLDGLVAVGTRFANGITIASNEILENFEGLRGLRYVNGWMQIRHNPELVNFQGMNNLELINIGGLLSIINCDKLESLDGLNGLKIITQHLRFLDNERLQDISALSNLEAIFARLDIYRNNSLLNLNGLEGVTNLEAVGLIDNPSLHSIAGLSNLEGNLSLLKVEGNKKLTEIQALHNINSVDHIYFTNSALTSLKGLENVIKLKSLEMKRNESIEDLDAFENLSSITNYIEIQDNPNLSNFCGLKTSIQTEMNVSYTVSGNSANPSKQEIIDNCQ